MILTGWNCFRMGSGDFMMTVIFFGFLNFKKYIDQQNNWKPSFQDHVVIPFEIISATYLS
jgi:hypothetical protein